MEDKSLITITAMLCISFLYGMMMVYGRDPDGLIFTPVIAIIAGLAGYIVSNVAQRTSAKVNLYTLSGRWEAVRPA